MDQAELPDSTEDSATDEWLELSYDLFPRIEDEFRRMLDESLEPRGPDVLYDLVAELQLPRGAVAVDLGCGEGKHTFVLAERFGLAVAGIDPVPRHVELCRAELERRRAHDPDLASRVEFQLGSAEASSLPSYSFDLVWCRDVLVHVSDLGRAYGEIERVLRPGGHAVVYQMLAGKALEPREASWLWKTMGVVPTSTDPSVVENAIGAAGLRIDARLDLTTEWGEWAEERSGRNGRRLLHAARLLRDPERYVRRFGRPASEIMLGDCLWHVFGMIGKLDRWVYVVSKRRGSGETESSVRSSSSSTPGKPPQFSWRGDLTDDELVDLTLSHGGRAEAGWWDRIRPHSLGWVTARADDSTLVGFVNVAWDGGDHAFLIDTKVRPTHQRRGIGTELVRIAAARAMEAGCEWLEVDFGAPLTAFYIDACGFVPTPAGLLHLPAESFADLP